MSNTITFILDYFVFNFAGRKQSEISLILFLEEIENCRKERDMNELRDIKT